MLTDPRSNENDQQQVRQNIAHCRCIYIWCILVTPPIFLLQIHETDPGGEENEEECVETEEAEQRMR